jgi:hypothetical protein
MNSFPDGIVLLHARSSSSSLGEPSFKQDANFGLDGGETGTDTLEAGSVIAFEPMFSVGADAYYMEDMILVTASGHEVLTRGLPYTADEIEAVMRR